MNADTPDPRPYVEGDISLPADELHAEQEARAADTPDPRPSVAGFRDLIDRPVSPLSELTAEPLTDDEIEVLRILDSAYRLPVAVEGPLGEALASFGFPIGALQGLLDDRRRLLATLDAARAAPQADAGLASILQENETWAERCRELNEENARLRAVITAPVPRPMTARGYQRRLLAALGAAQEKGEAG